MDKLFKLAPIWSLTAYAELNTCGLHSNERAATIESYFRTNHKHDSSVMEILSSTQTLQKKDMSLECNSKEAHAYFTHPVYGGLRKHFSPYALSLMLHQLLLAAQFITDKKVEGNTYKVSSYANI